MAFRPAWDLFPRSREAFSDDVFDRPGSEYRGTPLWSWNGKLEKEQLMRQIDDLEAMGLGGFHMHTRVGLDTEYLGEEFMQIVRACVDRAKEKGMKAWLYDEDRWPSGFAGGKVTEHNDRFRSRHLLFTPWKYGDPQYPGVKGQARENSAEARRSGLGTLLATYAVELDEDGYLLEARRLAEHETGDNLWYAYEETNAPSEWFNGGYYLDTLSKEAVQAFIQSTHETYKAVVGDHFGSTVPAIFTDEPQFSMKNRLNTAAGRKDIFLPWTLDLEATFQEQYNRSLLDHLPEIIWDTRTSSKTRYLFHDHVCERFVAAFTDQIGQWCQQNGLAATGHVLYEERLDTQTGSVGEAMRCYRNLELPGIDMLCDARDYTVAKQATSVARQYGRCGVICEMYGVTNWTFTFNGHKGSGDWQAALGVNVRCHHLSWLTMAGEAKRDYPAAIGYQSPWYKDYRLIEDYFSRVNYVLSRGRAVVRVAVIHPIESYWLAYGPNDTSLDSAEMERQFSDLTSWLCHGLVDFDFISESLLVQQHRSSTDGRIRVGHSSYDAVILPNLRTIRSSTLKVLGEFSNQGSVLIVGSPPSLVDAEISKEAHSIPATTVPFSQTEILRSLEPFKSIKVTLRTGRPADSLLYQLREDGEDRYLFICNSDREKPRDTRIKVRGQWGITILDAFSGRQFQKHSWLDRGWTVLDHHFEGCGSLLLRLSPPCQNTLPLLESPKWSVSEELVLDSVSLSEPNVLLLDLARFRLDDEEQWSGLEEVLRTDNIARKRLGLAVRQDNLAQPYRVEKVVPSHTIHLKYQFQVSTTGPVPGCLLALEGAEDTVIELNGIRIQSKTQGWWVDESISTVSLPDIPQGSNTLVLSVPFGQLTNIERIYVLGSFGVDLRGRHAEVVDLNLSSIRIGDYCSQGLPFYAGNVRYNFTIQGKDRTALHIPRFAAPVLRVDLDGKPAGCDGTGKVAFPPYILDLGELSSDRTYQISVTALGNRDHAFGAVHLPDGLTQWYGPDAWRTNGDKWAYEYTIRPMGILTAPRLLTTSEEHVSSTWDAGSVDQDLWF